MLADLRVFSDGKIELGWIDDSTLMTRASLAKALECGELLTEPQVGERIRIPSLGSFEVREMEWAVDAQELLKEVDDIISRLNRRTTSTQRCNDLYHAYLASPSRYARNRLQAAYEAVPKHLRTFVGDCQDTRDVLVRIIIYNDEADRTHADDCGLDIPVVIEKDETTSVSVDDLATVLAPKRSQTRSTGRYRVRDSEGDVGRQRSDQRSPTHLFLTSFAKLTIAVGEAAEFGDGLHAVWHLDDTRWRLWVEERKGQSSAVFLSAVFLEGSARDDLK